MQAKISVGRMKRTRSIRYLDLFLGSDRKGEVRAQWSSLYQAFNRNQFRVDIEASQVTHGGVDMDKAESQLEALYGGMEDWCDANCTGFWTVDDNDEDLDKDAKDVTFELTFMFEVEDDLIRFIRDCALLTKLSN